MFPSRLARVTLGGAMMLLGMLPAKAESEPVPIPLPRPWAAALAESARRAVANGLPELSRPDTAQAPDVDATSSVRLPDATATEASVDASASAPEAETGRRARREARARRSVPHAGAPSAATTGQDYPQSQGLFVNSSNLALPPARGQAAGP